MRISLEHLVTICENPLSTVATLDVTPENQEEFRLLEKLADAKLLGTGPIMPSGKSTLQLKYPCK